MMEGGGLVEYFATGQMWLYRRPFPCLCGWLPLRLIPAGQEVEEWLPGLVQVALGPGAVVSEQSHALTASQVLSNNVQNPPTAHNHHSLEPLLQRTPTLMYIQADDGLSHYGVREALCLADDLKEAVIIGPLRRPAVADTPQTPQDTAAPAADAPGDRRQGMRAPSLCG